MSEHLNENKKIPRLSNRSLMWVSMLEGIKLDISVPGRKAILFLIGKTIHFDLLDQNLKKKVLALPSSEILVNIIQQLGKLSDPDVSLEDFIMFLGAVCVSVELKMDEEIKKEIKRDVEEWNNAHYPAGAIAAT